ncbi:MAG: hypothetical protein BWY66_00390 [bacterium ADurb.Bin374]|nr:MAG: hypothetical protein BWY66_00390 [bacterium ADurb.Bin374]
MSDWRQAELPPMKPVEQGRLLAPPYDGGLVFFEVKTGEWEHVCPCRFGEARMSGVGKWSGDSYRYDIFERGEGYGKQIALRWWNGAGEGWLIDTDKSRRGEENLLRHISGLGIESVRWDFCHNIWEAATKSADAAAAGERQALFDAFCEGRLKKRKRNGVWRMVILPRIKEDA